MDESVAGVLSVQCAHAFHADCLLRWGDASCPVCRCAQTPEPCDNAQCFECAQLKDEQNVTLGQNLHLQLLGFTRLKSETFLPNSV